MQKREWFQIFSFFCIEWKYAELKSIEMYLHSSSSSSSCSQVEYGKMRMKRNTKKLLSFTSSPAQKWKMFGSSNLMWKSLLLLLTNDGIETNDHIFLQLLLLLCKPVNGMAKYYKKTQRNQLNYCRATIEFLICALNGLEYERVIQLQQITMASATVKAAQFNESNILHKILFHLGLNRTSLGTF